MSDMNEENDDKDHRTLTRRATLKRAGLVAGTAGAVWAAPSVLTLASASAAGSPAPGANCVSFVQPALPPAPSGAAEYCAPESLKGSNAAQAQAVCEAYYGAACYLETADCAGPGYGPRPAGNYVCGDGYFGFTDGCSGDAGRIWSICNSFTTYGRWALTGTGVKVTGDPATRTV